MTAIPFDDTPLATTGAIDARLAGYTWGAVNDHLDTATDQALAAGYSQSEIDSHLGYQDPAPLTSALSQVAPEEPPPPSDTPAPLDPFIPQAYADAMRSGHAAGPEDFSETLASAWGLDPQTAQQTADQLPHPQDTIDHGIAIAHNTGVDDLRDGALNAHNNLLDLWAQTGVTPQEALARVDPILQDAIASPPVPYQPTLAELEAKGRDAITTPYGPWGGPLQSDPTGVKGFVDLAKALFELPAADSQWREAMLAAGEAGDQAKLAELKQHPPALETLTPLLLTILGGKVAGAAGKAAGAAVEKAAPTFRDMLADTQGSVPRQPEGTVPEGTPPEPPKAADVAPVVAEALAKRGPRPEAPAEMPVPPGLEDEHFFGVRPIEDALYRLHGNATADRISMYQLVEGLPAEWLETSRAGTLGTAVEQRLVDPAFQHLPEIQEILDGIKPLTDEQTKLATEIKAKLGGIEIPEVTGIRSVDEGYARRVVDGAQQGQSQFDPELNKDPITGANLQFRGPRTNPASLQPRDFYVMEDAKGMRVFGDKPLSQTGFKFGDEADGYTIKPATMAEVEENTKGWDKPIKYQNNFIANTADNVLKLRRINRLLDLLPQQRDEAIAAGKFEPISDQNRYQPTDSKNSVRVTIPQFDGWAAPEIGHPVNDLFQTHQASDLERALTAASRGLLSSLFISPVAHIANVGAHWLPGRGLDWINPVGYGRLISTSAQAAKEVLTMGPKYQELLREGMGGLYGDTRMANFTNMMMSKLFHEQLADGTGAWDGLSKVALGVGAKAVDLVKAEYGWSRRTLWAANDMFLMQRVLELEQKGLPTREAIYQAELDIPNYRVPSMVAGSHAVSQAIQNPLLGNFGRYHYGLVRALGANLKLISPNATLQERTEAVGKIAALGGMAYAYATLNSAFQDVTGNKNAEIRPPGPLSPIFAAKGFFGGQKEWMSLIGSIYGLSPLISLAGMVTSNRDVFGRKIVDGKATPLGQIVQALEGASNLSYPTQLLHGLLTHGPQELLKLININMYPGALTEEQKAKIDKRETAMAQARERKDPIEGWLRDNLGGMLPDAVLGDLPAAGSGRGGGARPERRSPEARDFAAGVQSYQPNAIQQRVSRRQAQLDQDFAYGEQSYSGTGASRQRADSNFASGQPRPTTVLRSSTRSTSPLRAPRSFSPAARRASAIRLRAYARYRNYGG